MFTSGERGIGFGGAQNVVYPPDWDDQNDDICCTDHLEEQLLPVTALGHEFAIARSPIRSTDTTGWKEPDIVRVVGTVDNTNVTTNLPPPADHFTVGTNQQHTFAATTGFAMSSDQAIEVATYLVSQHFVKHGYIGDPSQLLMPAAEQFRKELRVPGPRHVPGELHRAREADRCERQPRRHAARRRPSRAATRARSASSRAAITTR